MNELDRKYILNAFLKRVESINSKEYQRRVWIEGKGPECDDFGETADFFIDDGEAILKNYKDFNISDNQRLVLQEFWSEFKCFFFSHDRPYFPDEFIDSPEWTKITEMAKEVLSAFHWKNPIG
jgi:hypothetical protein